MAAEVTVRPPCRDNSCQSVRSTMWDVMKRSCSVSFTGKQIAPSVTFDYNQRWWLCSQREAEPRPTSLKNTASEVAECFEIKMSPLLNTKMSSCWDLRYDWNAIKIRNKNTHLSDKHFVSTMSDLKGKKNKNGRLMGERLMSNEMPQPFLSHWFPFRSEICAATRQIKAMSFSR